MWKSTADIAYMTSSISILAQRNSKMTACQILALLAHVKGGIWHLWFQYNGLDRRQKEMIAEIDGVDKERIGGRGRGR